MAHSDEPYRVERVTEGITSLERQLNDFAKGGYRVVSVHLISKALPGSLDTVRYQVVLERKDW
jgi:hypothetical protein